MFVIKSYNLKYTRSLQCYIKNKQQTSTINKIAFSFIEKAISNASKRLLFTPTRLLRAVSTKRHTLRG